MRGGIFMNVFEIMGPIMVGPSSSHTAGAVKIGYTAKRLLKEEVKSAKLYLHGSFLATGKGHGTDKALIAGLLGLKEDDERIPYSFQLAKERGMVYSFEGIELQDAHPNSVSMILQGNRGAALELVASSIGGGAIVITNINGIATNLCACYPTLIVNNIDKPGHISLVTSVLSNEAVNIATMNIHRDRRGGEAIMIIECDQEIPAAALRTLSNSPGITSIRYLSMRDEE
jgi:L-serine dehydratase